MLKICPECGRAISEYAEKCPNCGLPVSLFEKANRINKESSCVPDFIDLGLPSGTHWSSNNVGAKSAYDVGQYFAWGDSEVKIHYTWQNYKFFLLMGKVYLYDIPRFSKYVGDSKMGVIDAKEFLEPGDDPATLLMGANCCTPSYEQICELHDYCQFRKLMTKGISGYEVIGPNGNKLFFTKTGYMVDGQLQSPDVCRLWTNRSNSHHHNACSYYLDEKGIGISWPDRYYGLPIRPVLK